MGDERAARSDDSDSTDERRGDDGETVAGGERTVTSLEQENERLRDRLAERRHERERLVDHYETLLDAARRGSDDEQQTADKSRVERLLDTFRQS